MRRADANTLRAQQTAPPSVLQAPISAGQHLHRRRTFSTWQHWALPAPNAARKTGRMKVFLTLAAALLLPAASAPHASAPRPSWDWPLSPKPAVLRTFDPPDKPWMS